MHAVRTLLLVLIAAALLAPGAEAQESPRPWGNTARTGRSDARRVRRERAGPARAEAERARMAEARRRAYERSAARREQARERRRLQRRARQQQLLILQAQVAARSAAESSEAEGTDGRAVTPPAETPNSYATEQCLRRFHSNAREQQCIESGAGGAVVVACVRWLYGPESEIACLSAASDAARVSECGQLHTSTADILACIREN